MININKLDVNKSIIADGENYKVVYFKFEEGKGLPNHVHVGLATIQVLEGSVNMEFVDGNKYKLEKGDFLPFDASIEHNVVAIEEAKVLVTISKVSKVTKLKIKK